MTQKNDASPAPETVPVDPAALIRIGFVYRPHGVRGELKIDPEDTDDPTRFEALDTVYVGTRPQSVEQWAIASVRYQDTKRGTTVILRLDGIDSRDAAERVTKANVFAHEDALELDEGELFVHDLVGLDVVTEDGDTVGTLSNVMTYPAHDMLVVRRPGQPEALVPMVDAIVRDIDLDAARVVIRPIDGLLD